MRTSNNWLGQATRGEPRGVTPERADLGTEPAGTSRIHLR